MLVVQYLRHLVVQFGVFVFSQLISRRACRAVPSAMMRKTPCRSGAVDVDRVRKPERFGIDVSGHGEHECAHVESGSLGEVFCREAQQPSQTGFGGRRGVARQGS